ncbi:DNA repair protein rad8 [Rhodotorula toruloides NP11]|uniref:DNA repair protein rad8 n=1 Tax=Rhodotorula toruloides (strain NP11) TaxID=1130832 RepID=M7WW05_RHOT1|nr:DNA repair protein rad8 [Rhodotorula toruloides NP11]EMS22035.1 DNA repair protein rad8 [Rhodotorula toruloides NP11]
MAPRGKKRAASVDSDDVDSGGRTGTGGRSDNLLNLSLPPMHKLEDIFSHIVERNAEKLSKVMSNLGRPLRVATMCSGTESPILALRLMFRALEAQKGIKAEVDHIFSAEIEPFKQAYIERNFAPPLLFRDVTELPNDQARTAYGAFADVPGNADMLVAGTSCIDYSNLNNIKKGITDGGESGRTFFGMYRWVDKHRPKIVILENVCTAPWGDMVKNFAEINYSAEFCRLDTKKYYIPHTRTRVYLIAFPKEISKSSDAFGGAGTLAAKWKELMKINERPASSPAEAFLLHSDDPRTHRARQELSHQRISADGKKRDTVDWGRCEVRHSVARQKEKLGQRRPLTDWQDNGGKPTLPDGAWQDWAEAQTERVLDLMDISYLRQAKLGVDINYKSAIWNLSQNVDRTTTSKLFGITPCLTPNMIPYLTDRGGPVVGLEALALQGLPIDELLLTRESTDQLADLAGNAMSSTVVGTAMLSALLLAGDKLDKVEKKSEEEDEDEEDEEGDKVMRPKKKEDKPEPTEEELEARFRGADRLAEHPVDLASFKPSPADLLDRAHRSARKCTCEGPEDVSEHKIYTCQGCGHSSCEAHKGKPEHRFVAETVDRESPAKFAADLRDLLPMRFTVPGFERDAMAKLVEDTEKKGAKTDKAVVERYLDVIDEALKGAEFHFHHLTRRDFWTAVYGSERARLELFFGQTHIEWRIFVTAPAELGTLNPLRQRFEQPIARLKVPPGQTDLFDGSWSLNVPLVGSANKVEMQFSFDEGDDAESKNKSWRARLELEDFLEEKSPRRIKMSLKGSGKDVIDRQIDGEYEREDKCGTATHALYRRVDVKDNDEPLYFFFDPSPYLENIHDRFVFAETCLRVTGTRALLASLQPSWRLNPFHTTGGGKDETPKVVSDEVDPEPSIDIPTTWMVLEQAKIAPGGADVNETSKFSTIQTGFELSVSTGQCSQAETLLTATVPLAKSPSPVWATEKWHEVDLQHQGAEVFSKLGWMLSRIPNWQALQEWQSVATGSIPNHTCARCAPVMPSIQWIKLLSLRGGKKEAWSPSVIAREDGQEAARYENALKDRPSPIIIHTRHVGSDLQLKIGLNAASLAHRALSQLPAASLKHFSPAAPKVEWRLLTSVSTDLGNESSPVFELTSNRNNPEAANPEDWNPKCKLRPEQLRSLWWMIEQEANPKPWVEEEVAEALLPQLGWYAEAKATREVEIRGGVVADAVGYGKTAITLALIASRQEVDGDLPEETDRVPIKATLIVVPKHLVNQWKDEVKKFTKPALSVITIQSQTDLKKYTIKQFQEVDIVIVAESLFTSGPYWCALADFAASKRDIRYDAKAGRYFRHAVDEAMEAMGDQVRRIRMKGASAAHVALDKARKARDVDFESETFIPESRHKANAKAKGKAKPLPSVKDVKFTRSANVGDDDWGFRQAGQNWTKLKAPPLSFFSWARVVLDEFSYTDGSPLVGIHSCRGRARWILSGTPPMRDFSEIKSISNLLNIHLGIDDDTEGVADMVKVRTKDATAAEKFRSYVDVRTKNWHIRRNKVAQRFLDQFARQNKAEIDEIPIETELVGVRLPGAEMAIYRELEHHLYSIDPNLAKLAKINIDKQSDRDKRLREALGQSKTPEEALLKRCSHFSLDLDEDKLKGEHAPDVCDFIAELRQEQLEDCKEQVKQQILASAYMHRRALAKDFYDFLENPTFHFAQWVSRLFKDGFGDEDADKCLRELAEAVGCDSEGIGKAPDNAKPLPKYIARFMNEKDKKEKGFDATEWAIEQTVVIRDSVVTLNKLARELVGRFRSARYFDTVRTVLRTTEDDKAAEKDTLAILSCCGHHGKLADVEENARWNKCIHPGCGALVQKLNILTAESLGTDRDSGHFGYKLETLVTLIQQTPEDDRVLVFVQFDDLFDKVHEALSVYKIPTTILQGTSVQQSNLLTAFQKKSANGAKVLLLRATDSSSSGANLTIANWAFFVSPLLTDSKAKYKALATQAIGRIHRYGQLKTARVVHLLTHATLDVPTFSERNDCDVDEVMKTQPTQRGEIVNPLRSKEGKWERKGRAPATKKGGAKKAKKEESEVEAVGSDGDAKSSDESDGEMLRQVKKAAARKVKPVPAKKGKAKPVVISDDEEVEANESEEDEEEDEMSLEEDTESEDERPKKRSRVEKKRKDEDDFSASDDDSDAPPRRAAPPKKLPRRMASAGKPLVLDSSSEEEEEEEEEKVVVSAKNKGKGKAKAPEPKKAVSKKRRIADSDEDESEDEPPSKRASTSKAPAASTSSKPKSKPSSPAQPAFKKARSSFIGVVIESPKRKQSTLGRFFGKKPAEKAAEPAAPVAKKETKQKEKGEEMEKKVEAMQLDDDSDDERETTPSPVKVKPASSSSKEKEAATPEPQDDSPSKERQVSPEPEKEKEASPAVAEEAKAKSPSPAPAPVADAQEDDAASSPRSASADKEDSRSSAASSTGAGIDTALTTPASELQRQLGDKASVGPIDEAEEEAAAMEVEETAA